MHVVLKLIIVLMMYLLGMPAKASAEKIENVIAVMYFEYHGNNEQMILLRKGIAQMLISDLTLNSKTSNTKIVERDRLEEVIQELELGKSKRFDQTTVAKVGKLVGAKYLSLIHI